MGEYGLPDIYVEDQVAVARPSFAARDGADELIVAARLAGTVGDVLGGIDEDSHNIGRLAGRVEVLKWAETNAKVILANVQSADRFADTRAMEEFIRLVQDSLTAVQNGTGDWAGLIPTVVEDPGANGSQV